MTRLALGIVLATLAGLAATAEPARACSCVGIDDPRRTLLESDAAFVGRLLSRRGGERGRGVFVFRVEVAVKGRFGETVEVDSASDGAACGLEVAVGARIGLYLERERGRWTSSLCRQIAPDRLRAAARPLPRPNGRGPVAWLAGGTVGPHRLLALDRRGRTLAYGGGGGTVSELAVCPESRRALEVVTRGERTTLAVRDLRTLRARRLRLLPRSFAYRALACRSAAGDDALVYGDHHYDGEDVLLRVRPGSGRAVWRGRSRAAAVTRAGAFVSAGTPAGVPALLAVGLDGRARRLAALPRMTEALAPSADGRLVAGVAVPGGSARVFVVDVRARRVRTASLTAYPGGGTPAWVDARRFVVLPELDASALRTFALPLRRVGTVAPWRAAVSALAGTRVVGVERGGTLVAAAVPAGRPRALRALPSGAVYALVGVRAPAR
ncbi:MAG: hypothetical protein ICV64_12525 [Thermoleophilia bacterium]|nr:hypothetical protein [Thermoleophilia bacterium]